MNSYLKRREDVKSGKPLLPTRPRPPSSRDRYLEPIVRPVREPRDGWADGDEDESPVRAVGSSGASRSRRPSQLGPGSAAAIGEYEPVLPRLLPPKNRRRHHPPHPAAPQGSASGSRSFEPPKDPAASPPTGTTAPGRTRTALDPAQEATARVDSERARAAALLAERRRRQRAALAGSATPSSFSAGSTFGEQLSPAGSEAGHGGWGMYNREEVLAARLHGGPPPSTGTGRGGGRFVSGGGNTSSTDRGRTGAGGGWGERKERRQERESRYASGWRDDHQ